MQKSTKRTMLSHDSRSTAASPYAWYSAHGHITPATALHRLAAVVSINLDSGAEQIRSMQH